MNKSAAQEKRQLAHSSSCRFSCSHVLRRKLQTAGKTAGYENFAAEALTKQGYPLVYYKKENSQLEEDFFIRSASELLPVEIKTGNGQTKSMTQLIRSEHYPDIRHGLKFTSGNIGITDSVFTFPHYCLFLLKRYMAER